MSAQGFEQLLAVLDANRDRAGEHYERLRAKLAAFFRWRGVHVPDDLADETLDRVARRLGEGAQVRVPEPYSYCHGVAMHVLQEYWRDKARAAESLETLPESRTPSVDPVALGAARATRLIRERRLDCVDGCVAKLPPDTRTLLFDYHQGRGGERVAARQALARTMRLPLNALRIRVHRLRQALAACVTACESNSAVRH
jgi:DNA-directed RNA polymerase specialized sigma24 family protein